MEIGYANFGNYFIFDGLDFVKLKKKKYNWSKRGEIALLSFLFWTSVIILSFFWNTYQAEEQILLLADKEAKVNLERDLAFRRLATDYSVPLGPYYKIFQNSKVKMFFSHLGIWTFG